MAEQLTQLCELQLFQFIAEQPLCFVQTLQQLDQLSIARMATVVKVFAELKLHADGARTM